MPCSWVSLRGAGGLAHYGDNDSTGSHTRDIYYYYIEGLRDITPKWYAAARFSQILAPKGYPIVGAAPMGNFFNPFNPNPLTTDYWRLSLGVGYRFSRNLVLKGEYSFNQGRFSTGVSRNDENLFAVQAAFKF